MTEKVLLATPDEPAVGCVVEIRPGADPDGWSRFVSVDDKRTPEPDRSLRRWAPTDMADPRHIDRARWSDLCKATVGSGARLVLVEAGPLTIDAGGTA